MDEDQTLRNLAQSISNEDRQGSFNYWVRRLAYYYKTTTDEIQKLAIIRQEKMSYTGDYYDYR